jgi:hypothetical protein
MKVLCECESSCVKQFEVPSEIYEKILIANRDALEGDSIMIVVANDCEFIGSDPKCVMLEVNETYSIFYL